MSNFTVLMRKRSNGIVFVTYDGQVDSQEFRISHLRLLDEFQSLRFDKLVCDFSELELLEPRDRVWITTEWFPKATRAGLRAIAGIEPRSTTMDIILKKPLSDISKHFKIPLNWFATDDHALQWLQGVNNLSNKS